MALPVSFNTVTVTGRYLDFKGQPVAGVISFVPTPDAVLDIPEMTFLMASGLTATLDVTGAFTLALPATDDPDVVPVGWSYRVVENLQTVQGRSYFVAVPLAAGPTVSLAGRIDTVFDGAVFDGGSP